MAEKTNQAYPLAPANGYRRSDAESLQSADELKRKKRTKLAIYIGIFIVFQILVITALSLTVMKVKTPKVRLGNINVQNFNSAPATPSFDTKFTTQIKVKNTNFGPYKYDAAIVTFLYQGATVGQVSIPKSKAGMLSTKKIDVEVSLSSSALSGTNLGSELNSGVLTLNSAAKLTGKVELMLIMKKKKSSTMDCTMAFDLSSKTLKNGFRAIFGPLALWTLQLEMALARIFLVRFIFGLLLEIVLGLFRTIIEVRSNRLPKDVQIGGLGSEINSGYLNISSYAKISGRVHLMNIMKKRKTIDMNCTMVLVLKNKTVKDLVCK
ncbi:unnamed protein product [Malus baccata var. baccata]